MKERNRILALLLTGAMVAGSVTGCGSSSTDGGVATDTTATTETATTEAAETATTTTSEESVDLSAMSYDEVSAYLYEENLGEFYDLYTEAKEEVDNVSLRYAKMAIAEAKLLESGVLFPNSTSGGSYAISRVVPYSMSSVLWGQDADRCYNAIVTTELIKNEDRTAMKEKYKELKGTGTYREWVLSYLEEQGYELQDYYNTNLFSSDPTTWDVLSTSQSADTYPIIQTYDGLLVYDGENELQPALAESYEVSDDGLTYTFHIREGVKWVDSQGREVADVKADDFVAGLQHMMDCMGGLEYLVDGVIVGATEYINGEITDFSEVGVEAVDDYTLVYTLEQKCPYFLTMFGYSVFAPLSREYYESQGGKFGAEFDSSAADYSYGKSPDNIAYCGPFVITNFTSKNVIVFEQNDSYWNKDSMLITKMTWPYEDQSDPTKLYNDAIDGTVSGTGLNTSEVETAKADGIFDEYVYAGATTGSTFPLYYNLYRQAYANFNDDTVAVTTLTEEEQDRANAALQNQNFRLAISFSIDVANRQEQRVGEDLKYNRIRNSYTPGTFVSLTEDVTVDINGTETTFAAGTYYGQILQAQLDADGVPIKAFDETADDGIGSSDGYDGWYNVDNAVEYMNKAIEELEAEGVTIDAENPVKLELPYTSSIEWVTNQGNSLKQSVESAFDGKVEIVLIDCPDSTGWYYTGYYTSYGYEANYNITDVSGWGPDYGDPSTYLDTFLPDYAGYVTKSLGIY